MNLCLAFSIFPERASEVAWSIDSISIALLVLCGLITCGIGAAVLFCCIRYRAAGDAIPPPATETRFGSTWIEVGWTSITLLIFLGIFARATTVYFQMSRPPADAQEIHVVAKQWMWKLQHANGRREINTLHLEIGRPVKLVMISQDVIHDFFVPAFRTKQDVLPDRYTMEWFTPIKTGAYRLKCAEYCGMDHSRMGGWVYVMEPADYARWLASGSEGETAVAAGARLFVARGCSGCHSPNATVRAPLLNGVYNRPVALSDGSVVRADEQYLHDSILQPLKQITAGYDPVMPTYQGQLGEEEVMQLIAYLKSL
ncbi:MAG TPA: c-type cytochrome [Verrucomicrobiaceae bacterium]|jgi:cytochrome c oxidase subunit 2